MLIQKLWTYVQTTRKTFVQTIELSSDVLWLGANSFVQTIRGSFVQQIEPSPDALSMEEVVKLFSTAFEQICGLREVDKLVLERFRIIFQAAKDYGSLLAKKVLFLGIDVSSEWVVYKYDQGTWALMWPKAWIEILADDDYLKNYINQELDRYEEEGKALSEKVKLMKSLMQNPPDTLEHDPLLFGISGQIPEVLRVVKILIWIVYACIL